MPRKTDEEKLATLRALLQEGVDDAERGDIEVYDIDDLGQMMRDMIDEAVAEEEKTSRRRPDRDT